MKEDMYFPVFLVKDQTSTKKKEKAISNETNKKRILNDTKNTHISKKTLQRK